VTIALAAFAVVVIVSQVACIAMVRGARGECDRLRRDTAERLARLQVPGRVAQLERDMDMDLTGLPPFWRTLVKLHRAWDR
jgi:hypothetical protein